MIIRIFEDGSCSNHKLGVWAKNAEKNGMNILKYDCTNCEPRKFCPRQLKTDYSKIINKEIEIKRGKITSIQKPMPDDAYLDL